MAIKTILTLFLLGSMLSAVWAQDTIPKKLKPLYEQSLNTVLEVDSLYALLDIDKRKVFLTSTTGEEAFDSKFKAREHNFRYFGWVDELPNRFLGTFRIHCFRKNKHLVDVFHLEKPRDKLWIVVSADQLKGKKKEDRPLWEQLRHPANVKVIFVYQQNKNGRYQLKKTVIGDYQ